MFILLVFWVTPPFVGLFWSPVVFRRGASSSCVSRASWGLPAPGERHEGVRNGEMGAHQPQLPAAAQLPREPSTVLNPVLISNDVFN